MPFSSNVAGRKYDDVAKLGGATTDVCYPWLLNVTLSAALLCGGYLVFFCRLHWWLGPPGGPLMAPAYAIGCVCAAIAGACLATQSGTNSTLAKHVGKSFASVVSFAVGLGGLAVFYLVDVYAVGNKGPTREGAAAVPWWGWVGGFLGAFYVAVVIIFAPVLGAATLMAIFVAAQLSTAVVLDAFGWVGLPKRPLHWARLLGVGLMLVGVALISHFDGGKNTAPVPPPVPDAGGATGAGSTAVGAAAPADGSWSAAQVAPGGSAARPHTPAGSRGSSMGRGDAEHLHELGAANLQQLSNVRDASKAQAPCDAGSVKETSSGAADGCSSSKAQGLNPMAAVVVCEK